MATHSSVIAWRIPWTEKPGRLQSMGSHRVGHDWSDLAAAAADLNWYDIPNTKFHAAEHHCHLFLEQVDDSTRRGQKFTSQEEKTYSLALLLNSLPRLSIKIRDTLQRWWKVSAIHVKFDLHKRDKWNNQSSSHLIFHLELVFSPIILHLHLWIVADWQLFTHFLNFWIEKWFWLL